MLYRTSAAAQYRYVYVEYVRPRSTSGRAVHVQYVGVHDLCIDTVSLMLCLHYVGVHSLGLIVCLHAPRPQNHIVIAQCQLASDGDAARGGGGTTRALL